MGFGISIFNASIINPSIKSYKLSLYVNSMQNQIQQLQGLGSTV